MNGYRRAELIGQPIDIVNLSPRTAAAEGAEKTVQLQGTVFAAADSPAAGATVWAAKHSLGLLERRETISDANGRYAQTIDYSRTCYPPLDDDDKRWADALIAGRAAS